MNHYVVFDPDDDTGLTYRWHGGLTINVWWEDPFDSEPANEIDMFTMGSEDAEALPRPIIGGALYGLAVGIVERHVTEQHTNRTIELAEEWETLG